MADQHEGIPAELVGDYLLWLRRDVDTTPMHIIKLAYLSHGWMLGLKGHLLIDEPIEAWTYGPVVPSLYHQYKMFGGRPISIYPYDCAEYLEAEQAEIIRTVNNAYSDYTALQLSTVTHLTGSPWETTVRKKGPGTVIPNKVIQEYYGKKAKARMKTYE